MRLKDVADLQLQYSILQRTKMSKKGLCDLVIPFRDKYALTDKQALCVARKELSLSQIEKLLRNKDCTNADRIRNMDDEELASILNRVKEPCDFCQLAVVEGACTESLCDDAMTKWLRQSAEDQA